jgi:hypothetical protein
MFICRLCNYPRNHTLDCRNFSSVLSKTYRMWLFSINMDALESRGNTLSTKLVPHPPPHPENSGSMTSILVWCFLHAKMLFRLTIKKYSRSTSKLVGSRTAVFQPKSLWYWVFADDAERIVGVFRITEFNHTICIYCNTNNRGRRSFR